MDVRNAGINITLDKSSKTVDDDGGNPRPGLIIMLEVEMQVSICDSFIVRYKTKSYQLACIEKEHTQGKILLCPCMTHNVQLHKRGGMLYVVCTICASRKV